MHARTIFVVVMALGITPPLPAAEPNATIPDKYRVKPARIPRDDVSSDLGPRLLALLSNQVARNLGAMEADRKKANLEDPHAIVSDGPYFEYFVAGNAYAAAVLVRFGRPAETMAGLSRQQLLDSAARMIRAVAHDHHLGGGAKQWTRFRSARILHLLGMASWLIWEELDRPTQLLVARIIEHEADRFLDRPAPARLHHDTQAESNAWTGGGIAVAACMLSSHPHRELWAQKANEYMIGAYATSQDVASDQVVDGKPLDQWLTAPNAFDDYTVENHGLIHPDYIGAISEMVRAAVAFRLAEQPVPRAVTFNAAEVLDLLVFLYLPDGSQLYPQNTDYTPRRLDVFFQAANIIPHEPSPLAKACLLRTLTTMETMAGECPDRPMNGWIGFPYDLGSTLGLTQNYLMFRFFGHGGQAVPDDQLEAELAGAFVSPNGQFAVHRTANTISSFSWRATGKPPLVMGLTMGLDKDLLCYPMPWSYIGQVRESGQKALLKVHSHRLAEHEDGFAVSLELTWCSGKVRENCAFVSLPDGRSVYLQQRHGPPNVTLEPPTSGNVTLFDDTGWVYQDRPRAFFAQPGRVTPETNKLNQGNWINVDDRLGYAVLGSSQFRLYRIPGQPCIYRKSGTMYDTCRLEFVNPQPDDGPWADSFAVVTCPNQTRTETAALAERIRQSGWHADREGFLTIALENFLVYANFSPQNQSIADGDHQIPIPAKTSGWVKKGRSFPSHSKGAARDGTAGV